MSLLVRTPNWLGDAVMSFPAVNGILKQNPGAALWAHTRVSDLYSTVFPIAVIHRFPELPLGHSFKHLLLMPGSFSSALAGRKAGISQITGIPGDGRTPLLTTVRRIPEDRTRHHSLYYEAVADITGASSESPPVPSLTPSGEAHTAVFAGARYGDAKVWKGFRRLAEMLPGPLVFYGTDSEAEYLAELSAGTGAVVSTGNSIPELCSSLMSATAAVGNDSGGIHLAAYLGVPSIALFGSTSPAWTAPLGRKVKVIAGKADCSPCFSRTCRFNTPECLESISPDRVAEAVKEFSVG